MYEEHGGIPTCHGTLKATRALGSCTVCSRESSPQLLHSMLSRRSPGEEGCARAALEVTPNTGGMDSGVHIGIDRRRGSETPTWRMRCADPYPCTLLYFGCRSSRLGQPCRCS